MEIALLKNPILKPETNFLKSGVLSFSVQKIQNYWSGNAVIVVPHPPLVSFTPFFFVGPDRSFVCGNNEPVGARIHILFAFKEFLLSNKKPLSFTKSGF
jgi:hypothetical protein